MSARVVITGTAAICAAGADPEAIWETVCSGRSVLGPIRQWGAAGPPTPFAGEVADYEPRALVPDRKLHKLLRRTDVLGLYAARRAIEDAAMLGDRYLADGSSATCHDRTGVYVGSGGAAYQHQYDFFPLLSVAAGDLARFGRELTATINPMWLLRTLPNNVLCHVGIQYGFKGPNACITNHGISGLLAIAEAHAAVRGGEAERVVAIGHDAPVEAETLRYYQQLGLLGSDAVRPFDKERDGTLLGEGAAALVLEPLSVTRKRGARVIGEVLGSGCASEPVGLLGIRPDGDGLARAILLALADAEIQPPDVGMIVAHGNGTLHSDSSEAAAIMRVFAGSPPPVTAFKWAFGHLLAASGVVETVLALGALRHAVVPGITTFRAPDLGWGKMPVSAASQVPRSDIALVLSRGFAGTNAAVLVRSPGGETRC